MESAAGRIKSSSSLLVDHFVNLDYKSIRPTNISKVYPRRAMVYFDYTVFELQGSLLDFEFAVHALAFDIARFPQGPGKEIINTVYNNIYSNLSSTRHESQALRAKNHSDIQSTMIQPRKDNPSELLRLSKYTKAIITKTENLETSSLHSSTKSLLDVLMLIQCESRDWVTMGDYTTSNLAGGPAAFLESARNRSPKAVADQFNVQPLFNNEYYEKLIECDTQ